LFTSAATSPGNSSNIDRPADRVTSSLPSATRDLGGVDNNIIINELRSSLLAHENRFGELYASLRSLSTQLETSFTLLQRQVLHLDSKLGALYASTPDHYGGQHNLEDLVDSATLSRIHNLHGRVAPSASISERVSSDVNHSRGGLRTMWGRDMRAMKRYVFRRNTTATVAGTGAASSSQVGAQVRPR
jgi:hypothetical protein